MKQRIIILGGVVLAIIALWSLAWAALAGVVRQNVEALAQADGITAPRVSCQTLNISGFPFRFDVDCQTAQIVSGDLAVDVPGIRASVRVYAPTHVLASALGPLHLTDTFTGARNRLDWSALELSVRLADWRIARASLSGRDVVWSDTLLGERIIAQAPLAEVHLFDIPEQHDAERQLAALAGYVRAQNAVWPEITLSDANLEAELELTGLPDDVRVWGDPRLLPGMQAADGVLRIVAVRATDADASLNAEGALQLDKQGMIEGRIDIASTGVAERIGPLLQEPWRTLALGAPQPDGSYVNQLNFRSGGIFSGLVPIAAVPSLYDGQAPL